MPYGVSLPADAAHLHGGPPGVAVSDLGDHGADAADPRYGPMGHLAAQPRRVDAGDGHRRRTRLHVRRVRQGSADEGERRDPPPAGATAGQRPRTDRAVHRAAAVAARVTRPLLRRRDRHGRRDLVGGPRRGAYPDAVDTRPQRRVFHGQPRSALPAAEPRPGLWLPGRERGGPARHLDVAAQLHPNDAVGAPAAPRVRARHIRGIGWVEPLDAGVRAPGTRRWRHGALRQQPVAIPAADRTEPAALERLDSAGVDRARRISPHWPPALPADTAGIRVLLVRIVP